MIGRRAYRGAALAAALTMAGCAAPVGDLGRRDSGIFASTITNVSGPFSVVAGKVPPSPLPMTDEERELRNVGWDLARPPDRDVPGNAIYQFAWWRALPDGWYANYPKAYYSALFTLPVASHETRYARLIEQAQYDAKRMPAFRLIATRVGKADGARIAAARSLNADAELSAAAERRVDENTGVIRSVCQALGLRDQAYRYVLGRLIVETPSTRAVEAEAAIDALSWEITACLPAIGVTSDERSASSERRERKRLPPLITK